MGEWRLFAIGVDEVRDVFCASPELAADFRRIVAERFPPRVVPKPPGMLSRLGPLFRKPAGAVIVAPDTPLESDVADLLAGRYVAPERQGVAWQLLEAYLAATAWSRHRIELDLARFNDLEFDLARAGLEPRFGLTRLVNHELGIPLQTYPGLSTGYTPHQVALDAAAVWRNTLQRLSPSNRAVAEPYAAWLAQFHHYAEAAPARGRPVPDLIVVYRASAVSSATP